jgi:hypothetical protein
MKLKALWYCTKAKDRHDYLSGDCGYSVGVDYGESLNGKIVAESDFDCEEIIHTYENNGTTHHRYSTKTLNNMQILLKSCILNKTLTDYLGDRNYDKNNNVVGYAIHIKNPHAFVKPKELKDLYIKGSYPNAEQMFTDEIQINGEWFHPMTKAPQNMCYVYDKNGNKYVLISVHPEWLAMILNGLKTIEVRKKVLKEML